MRSPPHSFLIHPSSADPHGNRAGVARAISRLFVLINRIEWTVILLYGPYASIAQHDVIVYSYPALVYLAGIAARVSVELPLRSFTPK